MYNIDIKLVKRVYRRKVPINHPEQKYQLTLTDNFNLLIE